MTVEKTFPRSRTMNCPLLNGENVRCEAYRVFGTLQDAILSNICRNCPHAARNRRPSQPPAKPAAKMATAGR